MNIYLISKYEYSDHHDEHIEEVFEAYKDKELAILRCNELNKAAKEEFFIEFPNLNSAEIDLCTYYDIFEMPVKD